MNGTDNNCICMSVHSVRQIPLDKFTENLVFKF